MLKWIGAFDIRNYEFQVYFPVTQALRLDNFAQTVNNRVVYKSNIICAPFWLQQAMWKKTSAYLVWKHRHEIGHCIRAGFNSETESW